MQLLKSQASPDIAALLERFGEPLREPNATAPRVARRSLGIPSQAVRQSETTVPPEPVASKPGKRRFRLIPALAVTALISAAILLALRWQDAMELWGDREAQAGAVSAPVASGPAQLPAQASSPLEVALSSPDRVNADAGQEVDFPVAIDATQTLPPRSIIAVTALPEGASFSEGRPYGVTGWSLRPDEIGSLRLRLPARAGASDLRLELVSGDGIVLAQSETKLSIAPSPAQVAKVVPVESIAANDVANTEAADITGSIDSLPPLPARKPASSAGTRAEVKVTTVKVVTIPAPNSTAQVIPKPTANPFRPHDGGYALGPATEDPQPSGEWMTTKTAVDMHAKPEQSSETVKVAEGGVKMRVVARDKNWVQVTDPKTSTTGWIYNRFLTPTELAAQ